MSPPESNGDSRNGDGPDNGNLTKLMRELKDSLAPCYERFGREFFPEARLPHEVTLNRKPASASG